MYVFTRGSGSICKLPISINLFLYFCSSITEETRPEAAAALYVRVHKGFGVWPLHDIVINNIVWYMAYKRRVGGGGAYIAQ